MAKQNKKEYPVKSIINNLIIIGGVLTALSFAYQYGKKSEATAHRLEIIELRQQYNTEISDLKMEYNQRIIESNSDFAMEITLLKEEIKSLKNERSHGK